MPFIWMLSIGAGDRAIGLPTGEQQPQHEVWRVVGSNRDTETYYSRAGRWKVEGLAGRLSERYSSVRAVP